MSKFHKIIDNRLFQNLFVWASLFVILLGAVRADNSVMAVLFIIGLLAPAVYINNNLILPHFNKRNLYFFILFICNTCFFTAILVYAMMVTTEQEFQWSMFVNLLGVMVLALTFGSAIKMARDGFYRRQEEKDAELKLLKAQLNPHFLFNTLNNLYGLSVIKSDKLPDLMLKLSDLLRYSLYDTKETFVPLQKELKYLENYIALEKIRLNDNAIIEFDKKGDTSTHEIAPMLLIVFIENAFKHLGVLKNGESHVFISAQISEESITLLCENTMQNGTSTTQDLESKNGGIGLQNAKRRLNLIYPDKHDLDITQCENKYIVNLTLKF